MKRFLRSLGFALGVGLLVALSGCKTVTTAVQTAPLPGACNAVDSTMYQTLVTAQASILSLESTLANPGTTPATVTTLKPYVSESVTAYNLAEAAWQAYHAACVVNGSASSAAAQAAVNTLQTAISATPKVTQ